MACDVCDGMDRDAPPTPARRGRSTVTVAMQRQAVRYCSQECAWQQSGELSVAGMYDAWLYARRHQSRRPTPTDVLALGRRIDSRNDDVRRVPVMVGGEIKAPASEVQRLLLEWVAGVAESANPAADAGYWFEQFEEIHPFVDGNGRTGSLLHNWLLGRLDDPIHPPNLWDDPRRGTPSCPNYPEVYVP